MWLLSQYSSQHCGVYTYILAVAEFSSSSIDDNRHRPLYPQLLLFLVHNYIPLAHNLDKRVGLLCCLVAVNFLGTSRTPK
jgi:hypothetical protein